MKRSQSIILDPRPAADYRSAPRERERNASVVYVRVSSLGSMEPAAASEYRSVPSSISSIRIVRQKMPSIPAIKTERREQLKAIDKSLYEKYHPCYKPSQSRNRIQFKADSPEDQEISNVVVRMEAKRKRFLDRYQKLFSVNKDVANLEGLESIRNNMANLRVKRTEGVNSNFYRSVRNMLQQIE
jgi:hypothetical protein